MKGHVLYVEDDAMVNMAITRLLRNADYGVFSAQTIDVAHIGLQSFQFDVVVSDWNLGAGVTGEVVFALVKEHQPRLSRRFIFLSSEQPQWRRSEHVPWLEKPVRSNVILKAVDDYAELSRAERQTLVGGSPS